MATLREIRKRLQSAGNIKQITKAMELVAAARLHRIQAKAEQARPYIKMMEHVLGNLSSSKKEDNHPLLTPRAVKRTAFFIISADRGLCGSYNSSIFAFADQLLKDYTPENVELIVMGKKAIEYYQNKHWQIRYKAFEDGERQNVPSVKQLVHKLSDWYLKEEFDEIQLVYTKFINVMSRKVVVERFLSIAEQSEDVTARNYLYEPSSDTILEELLPRYLVGKLLITFDEAYASELAARVFSMRTATKNADEMIYNLTLTRNKVRQAGITKEMLEIINGAEGLK